MKALQHLRIVAVMSALVAVSIPAQAQVGRGSDARKSSPQPTERDQKTRSTKLTRSFDAAVESARDAVRAGNLSKAGELIARGITAKSRAEKQAWQVVRAELELARGEYRKAGLLAMRLVILHADSQEMGGALYCAAQAYEGMNRPALARQLYDDCIKHETTSPETKRLAQKRLANLKGPAK